MTAVANTIDIYGELTFSEAMIVSRAMLDTPAPGFSQPTLTLAAPPDDGPSAEPEHAPPPHPKGAVSATTLAAVEVLRGLRPAHHIIRSTTPQLHEVLARQGTAASRSHFARRTRLVASPLRVRRVLVHWVDPDTIEATVLLDDADRVRAVAARFIAWRGRWRLAALEVG